MVVMDKSDYVRLLKESSINDETKISPVRLERPKARGRPPKFYHPLLPKEKELSSAVQRILPQNISDSVVEKGSRLARRYGLPKTHNKRLALRPILSATGTYNYKLAKLLNEKLKPLSVNEHTVSKIFVFTDELRKKKSKTNKFWCRMMYRHSLLMFRWMKPSRVSQREPFENDWFKENTILKSRSWI